VRAIKLTNDTISTLAWLAAIDREVLARVLKEHWQAGDTEVATVRLRAFRVSAANAARQAREPVPVAIRREVDELVEAGLARNLEAAFVLVARNRTRSVATIRTQYYKGRTAISRNHTCDVATLHLHAEQAVGDAENP
jgi:hypothetical protein